MDLAATRAELHQNLDNMTAFLWIDQIRPAASVEEAQRLGSPYVYTVPCAGAASFLAPASNMSPKELETTIRSPVGCNIATNIPGGAHVEPTNCQQLRFNYVCELELNGDPSIYQENELVSASGDIDNNSLRRRTAAQTAWLATMQQNKSN